MSTVISLAEHLQIHEVPEIDDGPITRKKLDLFSKRLLEKKFKSNWFEMVQAYSDFCFARGAFGTDAIYYEWLCLQLDIKAEKDIRL